MNAATPASFGIRIEMLRPHRYVWVLTAPDGEDVADLAESVETYVDPAAALAAGERVLARMLAQRLS